MTGIEVTTFSGQDVASWIRHRTWWQTVEAPQAQLSRQQGFSGNLPGSFRSRQNRSCPVFISVLAQTDVDRCLANLTYPAHTQPSNPNKTRNEVSVLYSNFDYNVRTGAFFVSVVNDRSFLPGSAPRSSLGGRKRQTRMVRPCTYLA